MKTQCYRLKKHFEKGSKVSRLFSFNVLGIAELSARCLDLEHAGYIIHREWITIINKFGENIKVVEYSKGDYTDLAHKLINA